MTFSLMRRLKFWKTDLLQILWLLVNLLKCGYLMVL